MRKLFFALMAVAAITMTGTFAGCEKKPINDPEPEENFTLWGGVDVERSGTDTTYVVDEDAGSNNNNNHQHP